MRYTSLPTLLALLGVATPAASQPARPAGSGVYDGVNADPPAATTRQGDATPSRRRGRDVSVGAFGGLGFPRPLSVEGMVRIRDWVGLGVEYSVLPTLTISDVRTSFWALAGDLRVFPFRKTFFIGMAAGYQRLGGETSTPLTGDVRLLANTWFVNPRAGLLVTTHWGLTLGIDAGVQIPVSADIQDDVPPIDHPAIDDARSVVRFFGKRALPTVELIRIGFMF